MELQKGENMLKHEDEIFSRPARTWFQSTIDKAKSQGMVKPYRTVIFLTVIQK
jgi:ATP-dependent RNA helicase DDX27